METFNVGVTMSGLTVAHCQVHLIPLRAGNAANRLEG
jgi:hypothetical protein